MEEEVPWTHVNNNSDEIPITVGPENISSKGEEESQSDWVGRFQSIGGEPSSLFFVFCH